MRKHIDEITKLIWDLNLSGIEVNETNKPTWLFIFWYHCLKKCENFKTVLDNHWNTVLPFDFIPQILLDVEAVRLDAKKEKYIY